MGAGSGKVVSHKLRIGAVFWEDAPEKGVSITIPEEREVLSKMGSKPPGFSYAKDEYLKDWEKQNVTLGISNDFAAIAKSGFSKLPREASDKQVLGSDFVFNAKAVAKAFSLVNEAYLKTGVSSHLITNFAFVTSGEFTGVYYGSNENKKRFKSDVLFINISELNKAISKKTLLPSERGWLFPAGAGVIPYQCHCQVCCNSVPRRGGGDPDHVIIGDNPSSRSETISLRSHSESGRHSVLWCDGRREQK